MAVAATGLFRSLPQDDASLCQALNQHVLNKRVRHLAIVRELVPLAGTVLRSMEQHIDSLHQGTYDPQCRKLVRAARTVYWISFGQCLNEYRGKYLQEVSRFYDAVEERHKQVKADLSLTEAEIKRGEEISAKNGEALTEAEKTLVALIGQHKVVQELLKKNWDDLGNKKREIEDAKRVT